MLYYINNIKKQIDNIQNQKNQQSTISDAINICIEIYFTLVQIIYN